MIDNRRKCLSRQSSHRFPLSSLSTEIRIAQLIYYSVFSCRRIPSRLLLFGPCRMELARRSAEGLKITIDADLLPRYLLPRDSRFAKIPRIYPHPTMPSHWSSFMRTPMQRLVERCILFIRDVFRQVTKCASTNFSGNITRKRILKLESIRTAISYL